MEILPLLSIYTFLVFPLCFLTSHTLHRYLIKLIIPLCVLALYASLINRCIFFAALYLILSLSCLIQLIGDPLYSMYDYTE